MAEKASSLKTCSRISGFSVRSSTSSSGSAAIKVIAKAEAAKACLSYAEGEISLKPEKAKLQESMEMLNYEKEAAVAIVQGSATFTTQRAIWTRFTQ